MPKYTEIMHNKRVLPVLIAILFLGSVLTGKAQPNVAATDTHPSLSLVELFTSEGCSSCPAADEVVAHIAKLYPDNVLVLSFHVDYWDRLGWKDAYSSAEYTRRQKQYAEVMNLSSIYTPQVIVNGDKEFVGSDEAKLKATIKDVAPAKGVAPFVASAVNSDNKSISVTYNRNKKDKNTLFFALVQIHAETAVKNGENAGRHLQHTNIVRALADSKKIEGMVNLVIPSGLAGKDCRLIAFLQDPETLHVADAREIVIR